MQNQQQLINAITQWQIILGDRVRIDEPIQTEYGLCTFPLTKSISAILQPHTINEIIQCVTIANHFHIPIYTISTGNNWGYGSSNPVIDQCVIMDLSLMNQIIDFDDEAGLVTLQPGVTQGQLSAFLIANNYNFMVPTTGAGPHCSIIGNALERGYGLTPYSDHFSAIMSLEAILADGSLYQSAHHSLGVFNISKHYKWGIGPYLDGLFSQGNFGIVTQMTLALCRRPEKVQPFIFEIASDNDLMSCIPKIQILLNKLGSHIGGINLMNNRRILAVRGIPYPRTNVHPGNIMSEDMVIDLCKQHRITPWTGIGAIYSTNDIASACQKIIKNELKPYIKKIRFPAISALNWAEKISKPLPFLGSLHEKINTIKNAFQILDGIPNETALKLAYWKSGTLPKAHEPRQPDKDRCGILWFAPLVPLKAQDAHQFITLARSTCEKHGIEPLLTLSSLSERCFDCTLPILFNPDNPKETAQALACQEELLQTNIKAGYYPYRLDIKTMNQLITRDHPYWDLIARVKHAVDPNNILSPGRYSPP